VTHTCSTWEVEKGRIAVQSQPRQKVSEIPSQPISQVSWYVPIIPATREAIGRRLALGKTVRPYLKNN
jgi:hypothetical protein